MSDVRFGEVAMGSPSALVVGVSGLVGRAAALAFLRAGYHVTGVSRGHGEYRSIGELERALRGVRIVQGDMAREETARKLCSGAGVVVFAGGISGVLESFRDPVLNLTGNGVPWLQTLQFADEGARVLLVSSQLVYGPPGPKPFKEDDTCRPHSPYALHRLLMEDQGRLLAERRGLGIVVLRLGNVYGDIVDLDVPRSHGLLAKMLRDLVRDGRIDLYGGGQQRVDLLHAEDLAEALVRASICSLGFKVYNVSGERLSIREVAEALRAGAGRGKLISVPWPPRMKDAVATDIALDDDAFRETYSWSPKRRGVDSVREIALFWSTVA